MDIELKNLGDDLGPSKVLFLQQSSPKLEAFVVIDNVACGPAMGGIRVASNVTVDEVSRLARAMTLKNAAAGLPHGGGKAGIVANPSIPREAKESLIRAFAHSIRDLTDYIPGPDMGVNEECMAWIQDEIGRVVGLPRVVGGIPLDEIGATGFGLAVCAEVASPFVGIDLARARVAVQGFGAVGMHAARFLSQRGAKLVAASDSHGGIFSSDGLPVEALIRHKKSGLPLLDFSKGTATTPSLIDVDCDIWIPAARPDVLTRHNVNNLRARIVLQGANIPATSEAEEWMHERGILNIPDFIANSGGVICASVEYHGGTEAQALTLIADRIRANTREILNRMKETKCAPRQAATEMAVARVQEAQRYRRHYR
jgi:glutamate dehydrogenase/leucine dehydrogenase